MGITGKAVLSRFQGTDQIETQESQVRQVVCGELFTGQVGVDQAKPPKTAGGGAKTVQGRDQDVVVRPYDDVRDFPPAGHKKTDLTVDLTGEFRQRPGQFMGEDLLRRDAPPVELPDPFDLRRSESGQVAVNLFDG